MTWKKQHFDMQEQQLFNYPFTLTHHFRKLSFETLEILYAYKTPECVMQFYIQKVKLPISAKECLRSEVAVGCSRADRRRQLIPLNAASSQRVPARVPSTLVLLLC